MSNISTIYDTFVTKLTTLYPTASGYLRLADPVRIEENPAGGQRQGWAISMVGGATNLNALLCNYMSTERLFTITNTRKSFSSENNASSRATAEKTLLEDHHILRNNVEKDPTLGSALVSKCVYVSDNGIESVLSGSDEFLMIQSVYSVTFFEAPV